MRLDKVSIPSAPKKICVYVDGFNLYHAVDELKDNRLKWLNFYSLAKSFEKPGEKLNKVYFFTAVLTWNYDKQQRHRNFIAAQEALGVRVIEANFKKVSKFCHPMNRFCKNHEEKQTDVAIAVTLLEDAMRDEFDRAILVTADSDQMPLVTSVKRLFPDKWITLSAPPGRAHMARELGAVVHDRKPLSVGRLHAHRMPRDIYDQNGNKVASMPALYLD
ncbi:MAG TPA: NYN domain-containing protein [Allosphingosinicella sp.]